MNFEEAEKIDGVRLSWNVWPTTRLEQLKLVLPLGVMYTPLINQQEVFRCNYPPLKCRNTGTCSAILSPWSEVDWVNKLWVCPLCLTRNQFPPSYSHISQDNMPNELDPSSTTIEYEEINPSSSIKSSSFLFVIDTAVDENELDAIKSSIQQQLTLLPSDSLIGLITYGKHVSVHEIGFISRDQCNKCLMFRGDIDYKQQVSDDKNNKKNKSNNNNNNKSFTIDRIKHLLEIDPNNPSSSSSYERFFQPVSVILDDLNDIFDDFIRRDAWIPRTSCRADKCTGVAAMISVALMEACLSGINGRIILFTGGAPTIGPGSVVDSSLAKHLRGHKDILKGKAPKYDIACKFYNNLSNRCVSNGHIFDIFACSLDQLGIAEQRIMCDNTGGVLVLSDTFTTRVFEESFNGLFYSFAMGDDDDKDDNNVLSMCFNGEIRVRCSRQIKVSGCIGPVSSMNETTTNCYNKDKESGLGFTSKWSCGGLFSNTTLCFLFDISSSQKNVSDINTNIEYGYIQFITNYISSYNTLITRVTTIGVQFANPTTKIGLDKIISGFDQEAASVILARVATYKADNEFEPDLMRFVDNNLIKTVTKFASYIKSDVNSFKLPSEFLLFPQFMYYLRRSQFIQVFNYSPDETAFFRSTLIRENVSNGVSMIQPLLHAFDIPPPVDDQDDNNATNDITPEEVLLELSSRHPERILLLDTFFHLVIWYGRKIAKWRNNKIWENSDYGDDYLWFKDLLLAPKNECNYRISTRFPCPNLIECDENSGQQRFLIAKLNPDNSKADQQYTNDNKVDGDVWTDDVSLKVFMAHLKKLAVNPQ